MLEHLLRHRDVAKLKSTVDGLLKSVSADGRIHTTYFQTVAATGRLSSTDPNLQNIPIRTEEGRRIRRAFVVVPGHDSLMTADYSQIEMRIMAHLSGDAALVEAFNSGFDFHAATASSRLRRAARRRRPRAAPPHQGDELRPRLRPVRVRSGPAARHHAGRGDRADGGILHPLRRRPRLPARGRRAGQPRRLHLDAARPPPLPARPGQRQPPAPRDGRADGAQRPDPGLGRRHHEDRDAARRRGASARPA